jgi:hypothetical protein
MKALSKNNNFSGSGSGSDSFIRSETFETLKTKKF